MLSENTNSDKEVESNSEVQWENLHMHDDEQRSNSTTSPIVDNKALQMMKLMGFTPGLGLGKDEQGITAPVDVITQLGKRGFGLKLENLQHSDETWDFEAEEIHVKESVDWLLNNNDSPQYTFEDMKKWITEDTQDNILDEHNFCDNDVLQDVLRGKNIFDELDLKELCQARVRANPFETIRCVFFMNRAALKMANIDAATNFMFTNIDRDVCHKKNGIYYFGDVCAGPGGFTEYILWRKKWSFKGFGFTLKGDNDFKLSDSVCSSPVTFCPLYGVKGDGNVCCPDNIWDFKGKILHETDNKGVHFMMSDGGFSVEGNENFQEVLSKNIYLCQCLMALEILRKHGHFVTKLFDVFSNFSAGLLYLMYKCFEKVSIFKPNSSRPANSERYFIGCNLKDGQFVKDVRKYLRFLANRLWQLKDDKTLDVIEIVPLDILQNDTKFFSYIYESNNRIARRQIINLKKLAVFCRNPTLIDHRQDILRKKCLDYWQIPDKPKLPLSKFAVEDLLCSVIDKRELLLVQPREFKSIKDVQELLSDLSDWKYTFMQCGPKTSICNFYAGVGSSKVYRLQSNKWVKVKNIQLVKGTLLYGEFVKEKIVYKKPSADKAQPAFRNSLHVIDALKLGDVSLADLNFDERACLIKTYCKAVNHEFRTGAVRIRPKLINPVESLAHSILKYNEVCGSYVCNLPAIGYNTKEECYDVNSVLLLKTNENQSFHSTYVLRAQLFISENVEENYSEHYNSLQKVVDIITYKF